MNHVAKIYPIHLLNQHQPRAENQLLLNNYSVQQLENIHYRLIFQRVKANQLLKHRNSMILNLDNIRF